MRECMNLVESELEEGVRVQGKVKECLVKDDFLNPFIWLELYEIESASVSIHKNYADNLRWVV